MLLFYCPPGHLIVEPPKKYYESGKEIPQISTAYKKEVLLDMLTRKLVQRLGKAQKPYVTIKQAEQALHLDRIKNPHGYQGIKITDIIEAHPMEFELEGKRIIAKWRKTECITA